MKPLIHHNPEHGFTLIELLIAMALIGIVAASLITSYTGQQESELSQEQILEMQENIRTGLHMMTSYIRMAGYDPYEGEYNTGITQAGDGLSQASALEFTYVDEDGTGTVSTKTISFYLYDAGSDGDNDLALKDDGLTGAIAENIVNVSDSNDPAYIADTTSAAYKAMRLFVYKDEDGDEIADPSSNLNDIRAVEIRLTARVDVGETDYTVNNATRTVTTLVLCRNLGL